MLFRSAVIKSIVQKSWTTTPASFHSSIPSFVRHGTHQMRALSSLFHPTLPTMAKVEILSLGKNNEITEGTLLQVMPIGSKVQRGDTIALVQIVSNDNNNNNNNDNNMEQLTITSPQTGSITQHYVTQNSTIRIGDKLLEIDDTIVNDIRAFLDHIASQNGQGITDEFLQQYLALEDIFRLEQIIKTLIEQSHHGRQQPLPSILSKALPVYERILELQQQQQAEDGHSSTLAAQAQTRTDLGVLLYNLGDLMGATSQLEQALELRQTALQQGNETPSQVAASHIHLGSVLKQGGNMTAALEHMKAAKDIQESELGLNHPIVASSYNNIGAMYYQIGEYRDALSNYEKALSIHQAIHGEEENAATAGTYHNIGVALKHLGDFNSADERLQLALTIRQKLLGNDSTDVAASHYALGQLWSEMEKFDGALEQYHAALRIQEKQYGNLSPITAAGYNNIGAVFYQQRNFTAAFEEYKKALDILQQVTPDHPDTAAAHNNVGLALYQLGQLDESLECHRAARSVLEGVFGKNHPALATTIGSIGNVLKSQNNFEAAMVEYREAHELLVRALGMEHPDVASSFNNQGLVLSQQGNLDEALEAYRAAAKGFAASLGATHPHTASCYFNEGLVLKSKGDKKDAREAFGRAYEIWEGSLGANHPHSEMALRSMEECL